VVVFFFFARGLLTLTSTVELGDSGFSGDFPFLRSVLKEFCCGIDGDLECVGGVVVEGVLRGEGGKGGGRGDGAALADALSLISASNRLICSLMVFLFAKQLKNDLSEGVANTHKLCRTEAMSPIALLSRIWRRKSLFSDFASYSIWRLR
jgi:hypothetical protein